MLSRISQLGARLVRETRAAGNLSSHSSNYYRGLSRHSAPAKSILFSTATTSSHHDEGGDDKEKISVTFVNKDGTEKTIRVPVGMSMLEAAHENDIELEGACEGSLACSTCHVIVMDVKDYNKLEDPTDEENDMLDLAFGLTETISVTFVNKDGTEKTIRVPVGMSMLEAAHENDIELEG
uniref:2Fe-2S ferredoxin-type domain-containing protein n=1 Tax=Aegilops tauschii subsp. strangulata TaxID=200361 RepID=A0A453H2M8_AEGTS